MKKLAFILLLLLISTLSYSQKYRYSGINNTSTTLFDSGSVTLSVKEFNVDSCGITKRQIYKCDFTFKNNNSYPVILKPCNFYTENTTDTINKVGCSIKIVSKGSKTDTLAAKAMKVISVSGETDGVYRPAGTFAEKGVKYHWNFDGIMPLKK